MPKNYPIDVDFDPKNKTFCLKVQFSFFKIGKKKLKRVSLFQMGQTLKKYISTHILYNHDQMLKLCG